MLVSAITPTPAGEGKTTTTIGLVQGLAKIGVRSAAALREPSLGPVFGMKGGGAGGGASEMLPMMDINLHFNGDFHAVSSAHNLLAALVDNTLHNGNPSRLDPRRVTWKRVIDMNDRALRDIIIGLGGRSRRHSARERLRHHGRERSDGDPLPRQRHTGPQGAARAHRRRLHVRRHRR